MITKKLMVLVIAGAVFGMHASDTPTGVTYTSRTVQKVDRAESHHPFEVPVTVHVPTLRRNVRAAIAAASPTGGVLEAVKSGLRAAPYRSSGETIIRSDKPQDVVEFLMGFARRAGFEQRTETGRRGMMNFVVPEWALEIIGYSIEMVGEGPSAVYRLRYPFQDPETFGMTTLQIGPLRPGRHADSPESSDDDGNGSGLSHSDVDSGDTQDDVLPGQ